jgi:hypothetical protein
MGEVWEAEDTRLGRRIAIKMLPAETADDPQRLARFEQEARAVAVLDHPGIVTVHSIEESEGHHFITMQRVEGRTLAELIEGSAGEGLPLRQFFDIAIQLADAVAAAHAHGIAHRDLKPANVMVTPQGRVLVLDFGLAKMLAVGGDEGATVATGAVLTGEGKILGTVAYMSPEQAEGRSVDERSDLFSLGVLLYELCTGTRPFDGDTQMSILTSIIRDTPAPVTDLNTTLPHHLGRIIRHCLEKDVERRTQSATDLRNDLEDLRRELDSGEIGESHSSAGGGAGSAQTIAARAQGASIKRWLLPAAVALIVIVLLAWWASRPGTPDRGGELPGGLETLAQQGDLDALHEGMVAAGMDSADADGLLAGNSGTLSLDIEPAATSVTIRRVTPTGSFSEHRPLPLTAGTPHRLVAGEYHVSLEAAGHEPSSLIVGVEVGADTAVRRRLAPSTVASTGMVLVQAGASPLDPTVTVPEFLIDATEVTHAEYLEFVTGGGYRNDALWPATISIDGVPTAIEEARRILVDRTGIPGPREWSGGRYPDGLGDHPVTGISWYEAQAYARWRDKELPGPHQWWRAAVGDSGSVFPWGNDVRTVPDRANFDLGGTVAAGSLPLGVSPFGCMEMAGNVREWLASSGDTEDARRPVAGGSWQDPAYTFDPTFLEAFAPDYTSDSIGLRLVRPVQPEA